MLYINYIVTGTSKRFYGFPRGKINEGETQLQCASREVWEEIGFDVSKYIS